MSRIMLDFLCEDGHLNEYFIENDTRETPCKECGKPAIRQVAAPRTFLDPISGDFPGATMSWEAKREQHMRLERKAEANNGPDASTDLARSVGA